MNLKKVLVLGGLIISLSSSYAQSLTWISSTEGNVWKEAKVKLRTKSDRTPALKADGTEHIQTFKKWGTCFNELGWDALNLLPLDEQKRVLDKLFAPNGELRISVGRISMNAND